MLNNFLNYYMWNTMFSMYHEKILQLYLASVCAYMSYVTDTKHIDRESLIGLELLNTMKGLELLNTNFMK